METPSFRRTLNLTHRDPLRAAFTPAPYVVYPSTVFCFASEHRNCPPGQMPNQGLQALCIRNVALTGRFHWPLKVCVLKGGQNSFRLHTSISLRVISCPGHMCANGLALVEARGRYTPRPNRTFLLIGPNMCELGGEEKQESKSDFAVDFAPRLCSLPSIHCHFLNIR